MSDTPRTDSMRGFHDLDTSVDAEFSEQLERELNAAQATIRQQELLDEEIMRLRERVKRLEEAGDVVASVADAADNDIGQHLQVARYNLHGLINTGEKIDPPNPPHTIHQAGIDASVVVRQAIRNARIEWKRAKGANP